MFGLFKKKAAAYPKNCRWSVSAGESEGMPRFVRKNDSAASLAGHPEYRFRVSITMPVQYPNEAGLPGNQEMDQMAEIEDRLSEILEANNESLHVLVITAASHRDLIYYTRSPSMALETVERISGEVTHDLRSQVEEDPNWTFYNQVK